MAWRLILFTALVNIFNTLAGAAAIHNAAKASSVDCVLALARAKADLDQQTNKGGPLPSAISLFHLAGFPARLTADS